MRSSAADAMHAPMLSVRLSKEMGRGTSGMCHSGGGRARWEDENLQGRGMHFCHAKARRHEGVKGGRDSGVQVECGELDDA